MTVPHDVSVAKDRHVRYVPCYLRLQLRILVSAVRGRGTILRTAQEVGAERPRLDQTCCYRGRACRRSPVKITPFDIRVSTYQKGVPVVLARYRSVRTMGPSPVRELHIMAQHGGGLIPAVSVVSSLRFRTLMVARMVNGSSWLSRTPLRAPVHRGPIGSFSAVRVAVCGLYAVRRQRCAFPQVGGSRHLPNLVPSSPSA